MGQKCWLWSFLNTSLKSLHIIISTTCRLQENRTHTFSHTLLFIIHNIALLPQFQFFLIHSAQDLVVKLLLMQTYLSFATLKLRFLAITETWIVSRGEVSSTQYLRPCICYLCIFIWGSLYLHQQHIVSPPWKRLKPLCCAWILWASSSTSQPWWSAAPAPCMLWWTKSVF